MLNRNDHLWERLLRQAIALFLCSLLIMQNDYFIGRTFAQDVDGTPRPDAHRLSGCEDTSHVSGDECTIQTVNYDHQDIIITEGYYSMLVLWAAAMMALFQIRRCTKKGITCGWSTLFSSVAGLALLAGEVVQIAMYSEAQDKIEYRPDMLAKYKQQCAGSGSGAGTAPAEEGAIDGKSICDQYAALVAQRKSYEKAKEAAEIKFMLQTGAAVAYALAAIIEYYAAVKENITDDAQLAKLSAGEASMVAAIAECTVGAGACEGLCAPCQAAVGTCIGILTNLIAQFANPSPMPSTAHSKLIMTPLQTCVQAIKPACAAAGVCAEAGAPLSADLEVRYQELECHNMLPCDVGNQDVAGEVAVFFKRPYYYTWQNFYFRPSNENSFNTTDDKIVTEQMRGMETEVFLRGGNQSPLLADYHFLRHLDDNQMFTQSEINFFQQTFNHIIPIASAGQSPSASNINNIITKVIGLSGAAVIIIVALFGVLKTVSDNLFATPLKRGLWNTLLAALAGGGAAYTKAGVIAKLEENIANINKILDAVDPSTNKITIPDAQPIPLNTVVIDSDSLDGAPVISNDNPPLPCASGGDGKGKCNEIAPGMAAALQTLELGSLAGMSKSLATLGKELGGSRDVSPSAMRSASSLANNAIRANRLLKNAKKLYNQTRGRRGMAPIPFEKVERDLLKNVFAQTHATLKAQKTDAKTLLGAMQSQGELSEQDKKRFAEKVQASEAQKKLAGGTVAGVAADPFASFMLQNGESNPALSLESESEINPGTEGEVAIDSSLVIRSNDIETNPAISLFEMLTSRYMKSAYPILFEEQK
ncbi:MAG: hypothetical protein HYV97_09250 [Bdellovibrio sp.]|nr:hypothetical protein [Bdellovibrio sp.]